MAEAGGDADEEDGEDALLVSGAVLESDVACPHSGQNLALGGSDAPQPAQPAGCRAPHSWQNLELSAIS